MYIFGDWNKCGEVMGLAPYGRPDRIKKLVWLEDSELVALDWDVSFDKPWVDEDGASWDDSPHMQHWRGLAWRIQHDTEEVLLERARWLRETTGARNLCIAGGVALNCVANGRRIREAGFENVRIQPAAGDNGIAIGCAYYGHLAVAKQPRGFGIEDACLGCAYTSEAMDAAAVGGLARQRPWTWPRLAVSLDALRCVFVTGFFMTGSAPVNQKRWSGPALFSYGDGFGGTQQVLLSACFPARNASARRNDTGRGQICRRAG